MLDVVSVPRQLKTEPRAESLSAERESRILSYESPRDSDALFDGTIANAHCRRILSACLPSDYLVLRRHSRCFFGTNNTARPTLGL